jgi:pyruvate/2-oxoglutarate dehydrogenase complex dihydrolipoamide acyltransferase (E2) component
MRPRVLDLRGVLDFCGVLNVRGVLRGVFELKHVLKGAVLRYLAVPGLVLLLGLGSAFAQSGDNNHAQDQSGKPAAATPSDAVKENQRKVDQFTEAAQAINGPAGNPECVWLGRRVVQLVWVDDLDTAFRHLDLYDRFGCPGGHIQAAFRCLTRFGAQIDDKVRNSLSDHVHGCWINPNAQPQQAAAPAAAPAPTTAGSAAPAPAAPQPAPSASPSPQPPAK